MFNDGEPTPAPLGKPMTQEEYAAYMQKRAAKEPPFSQLNMDLAKKMVNMAFSTKDSGQRREFQTGARRDVAKGKGRYDLLPREAIHRLAQLFERGAEKYGENNWQKGMPISVFLDSGLRHGFQALNGEQDEDHLISAAWNFLCAATIHQQIQEGKLPPELNDIFKN